MDTEVHEVFQVLMYVGGSCHGGLDVVGVDIDLPHLSLDRCSQLLHCGLQVLHQFRGVRRLGNVQRTELLGLCVKPCQKGSEVEPPSGRNRVNMKGASRCQSIRLLSNGHGVRLGDAAS